MKQAELDELKTFCMKCERCGLAATRTNLVFGAGSAEARIMFVGEAPGADEDKQGVPFAGRAGKLLTQLLADIGIDRQDVYIANILKCRPPDNRDPLPAEIESCREYLTAQIAIIQPRLLCALGRHAAVALLGRPDFKISKEHGKAARWKGMAVMPIFHPAAALHQPKFMEQLRSDFSELKKFIESKNGLL